MIIVTCVNKDGRLKYYWSPRTNWAKENPLDDDRRYPIQALLKDRLVQVYGVEPVSEHITSISYQYLQLSNHDIFHHFSQYYMMPYKHVTKDFLKDVLQGKKKLLKMNEVKFINAPLFDEIAVKNLYNDVVK